MNLICFSVLALAIVAPAASHSVQPGMSFYGAAHAKDGDSLTVGGREVRLFGIDAPEFDQTCSRNGQRWSCGSEAADDLSRLVTGRDVRCRLVSTDQYGRAVSRCTVGTTDINAAMVESGFATAYREYSTDYVAAETRARAAKLGIWSGTFEAPGAYRREVRQVRRSFHPRPVRSAGGVSALAGQSGCVIKGNQNRRGQWIYHVPGMPYYEQTRPEQLFCSEADALAAGYRRAVMR